MCEKTSSSPVFLFSGRMDVKGRGEGLFLSRGTMKIQPFKCEGFLIGGKGGSRRRQSRGLRMTILKDALNCGEPKAGLEMSLSNWDKVCSEATDGPWLSL